MTVTCRCGSILTAEPDGLLDDQRELRMQQRLGQLLAQHIAACDPEYLKRAGNLAAMFMSWQILAPFSSTDPKFAEWVESGRKLLAAVFEAPGPDAQLNPKGKIALC